MHRVERKGTELALLVALIATSGCASHDGYDSESHFFCSNDSACKRFGPGYTCVARRCTLPPGIPPTDGKDGASNHDTTSDRGGVAGGDGDVNDAMGGVADGHVSDAMGGVADGHVSDAMGGNGGASSIADAANSGGSDGSVAPDGGHPGDAETPRLAPIIGVMSTGGGGLAFVRIEPTTGQESHQVPLSGLSGVGQGITGWDPAAGRFYALVDFIDETHRLLGLDANTGAIVSSPVVDLGLVAVEVDGSGSLFGIATPKPGAHSFVSQTVNPATGVAVTLSDLPAENDAAAQGMSAIDAARGRYYHVMNDSTGGTRLLTLDTATGHVISTVPTDFPVYNIEVDADGALVTFVVYPSQDSELRFLDPATGTTTLIAGVGSAGLFQGDSAIDRTARIMYQTYSVEAGSPGLLAVDLASGHVSRVPLDHGLGEIVVCSTCR
jgi:hypothetical protein